jgi:hypothetical protein
MEKNQVYIEPATSDHKRAEVHAANAKLEKNVAEINKASKEEREKNSRLSIGLQDRRRHAACLGLDSLVKRLERAEKPAQAAQVKDFMATCQRHLGDLEQAKLQQTKGYDKPLDDLGEQAAKVLLKTFPAGTFTDATEATNWATQYLPMTKARHQQVINCDRHSKLSKAINKANKEFWVSFTKGVTAGTGTASSDEEEAIITLGTDRL